MDEIIPAGRVKFVDSKEGGFVKESQEQGDWYDIIRRSDGKLMASMPLDRQYLVYSRNGLVSCRPLLEDEGYSTFHPGLVFFVDLATASYNPLI